MTDYEKVKKLFTELGIGITEGALEDDGPNTKGRDIGLINESNAKIKGYSGFQTYFNFNEDGKFLDVGLWE